MSCAIFLNGEYEPGGDAFYVARARAAELVVAADGGHAFLRRHDLWPDLLVGDFDSLAPELLDEAAAAGVEVLRHPVRKDQTDAELAVAAAEARGAAGIALLGALGGAPDHLFGNVALLRGLAERGRAAFIASPGVCCRVLVAPTTVRLCSPPGTRVSLVPLGDGAVVTLRGLEYELVGGVLPAGACVGLSNRVAAAAATVGLRSGLALVLVFDGDEAFAAV